MSVLNDQRILKVLLVEDDDIFAMLLRESIEEHAELKDSFVIKRVSDGDEALDYVFGAAESEDTEEEMPDLIILDQRMPRMDGTAVLKQLRQRDCTRAIPVCMLSTSNQRKLLQTCYAGGANFCITKPGNLDELIEKVGRLLFFLANVVEIPESRRYIGRTG